MTRRTLIAATAAFALLSGCASIRNAVSPPPQGTPSGRAGFLVYPVGALRFEAPAAWRTSGSPQHLQLEAPDGAARLEISTPEASFSDEKTCLTDADAVMRRAASLEHARRHATRFANVPALTVEGDEGGWHVWAWAACDGGQQYQVFFTARSPATPDALEAYRTLLATARVGGQA
ncbi:MAG TPA: hypothetical protein VM753_12460 [Anaeromyxobacter sp.]|nr:hypothetical protein [Anaeromyxobacter sp.]